MLNKVTIGILLVFVLFGVCGVSQQANAIPIGEGAGPYLGLEYGQATGLGSEDIRFTIARIISAVLGLLGIIALVIILYAGFRWMTAGGNEENVKSAQKILFAAVIGLVIIMSAYAITRFVMTQLYKATTSYDYESTVLDDN